MRAALDAILWDNDLVAIQNGLRGRIARLDIEIDAIRSARPTPTNVHMEDDILDMQGALRKYACILDVVERPLSSNAIKQVLAEADLLANAWDNVLSAYAKNGRIQDILDAAAKRNQLYQLLATTNKSGRTVFEKTCPYGGCQGSGRCLRDRNRTYMCPMGIHETCKTCDGRGAIAHYDAERLQIFLGALARLKQQTARELENIFPSDISGLIVSYVPRPFSKELGRALTSVVGHNPRV